MNWPTATIAQVCLATEQRDPTRSPEETFRYIDISALDRDTKTIVYAPQLRGADAPSRARKAVRAGDVLVSTVRPNLNAIAIVPQELDGEIASTGFCVLRANPHLADPRFLFYRCMTPAFVSSLVSQMRGANYPAVSDGVVKQHVLSLPPLGEQHRIADILEEADTLRRKRTEADTSADRILPALFHKLFGDPATNPRNLPFVPLGELATRVTKGESPGWQGFHYQDSGPLFVTSENVRWGIIDLSEPKHIPLEFHQKLDRSALKPRDILINLVGASIGRSCLVPELIGDANVNQAVAVVTCGPRLLPEYLASLLLTPAAQARLHGGKVEAARANISLIDVRRFPVPLPRLQDQQRFVAMRQQSTTVLHQRNEVQQNIRGLFAALLHRAFTGALTAKWRPAHMEILLTDMEQQTRLLNPASPERS